VEAQQDVSKSETGGTTVNKIRQGLSLSHLHFIKHLASEIEKPPQKYNNKLVKLKLCSGDSNKNGG
jgi:hypothetical protein